MAKDICIDVRSERDLKPEGGTEKDKWEEEFMMPSSTSSYRKCPQLTGETPVNHSLLWSWERSLENDGLFSNTTYHSTAFCLEIMGPISIQCNDLLGSVMENIMHVCCLTWPANIPRWMQLDTLVNLNSSKRPLLIFKVLDSSVSCSAFPLQAD